ncbi:hypothetical protein [Vibrio parahaemolyticus]|uniref:hypothetical protein n=1 Tax=Vibrio parahaemolyticus TaxID=670 RepID=UPI0004DAF07A|nr:hypothetical protein [Vibrio parahaemolyticus]EGQ8192679.1 hypothetical protein [Vibrio parahaemolyticus]EKB1990187.1 hypothetical protein [Vibrio parahaemolyticus]EME0133898.1 hypothetical protein [Vibrio parahaemolyticus]OAR41427.1 hypothetical protein EM55_012270 [Vibrio parahaemolyticus]OOQ78796.1 hypothetical protein BSR65_14335 [Vibrio parahaemolyticus]
MSQLAIQQQQERQPSAPDANESIAACKSLFNGSATRAKLRKMFNELPDKSRGLVLIAGGMSPKDYQREFESFNDLELQKIRSGMQYLKEMIVGFDNTLGDVRRLKHYQFSNTH